MANESTYAEWNKAVMSMKVFDFDINFLGKGFLILVSRLLRTNLRSKNENVVRYVQTPSKETEVQRKE